MIELSRPWRIARDFLAIFVTGLFFFPIFWWALASFKPISAMFDKDRVVWFDFEPHLNNYQVTLMGQSRRTLLWTLALEWEPQAQIHTMHDNL